MSETRDERNARIRRWIDGHRAIPGAPKIAPGNDESLMPDGRYAYLTADDVEALLDGCADAFRRGGVAALETYADAMERGPRLSRTAEVADMREVANRLRNGRATWLPGVDTPDPTH